MQLLVSMHFNLVNFALIGGKTYTRLLRCGLDDSESFGGYLVRVSVAANSNRAKSWG